MIDYVRMINPATSLATEDEATTAARAGALGAFLMAVLGFVASVAMLLDVDGYLAKMRHVMTAMYGEKSELVQMSLSTLTPQLVYISAAWGVALSLGIVILGVVQWKKPNLVIPLVLRLFTAYGLLMLLLGLMRANPAAAAMEIPLWRNALAVLIDLACLVLFWTGFRGGKRLNDLRRAAAT
ncbi:hypothetical protein [Caulobacter sp. BE254]|uniref:hypothetical protein n=1 Tax=Caulobacter sp. BE254 TaxID=2817720 RepID=UPI0028622482|nr:hypothetical protein [Caulobacter sp. BE254]MDR7116415.1 hypothetical protein [Caulobacter sp. BE254]